MASRRRHVRLLTAVQLRAYTRGLLLRMAVIAWLLPKVAPAAAPPNVSPIISPGPLPLRVHVFEDYETEIEKRWWLRGVAETNNVPPAPSSSVPNRRACRATATTDFDDKMGDATKSYKAVVFNPVPGPPMGANTRLSFRYWLQGSDTLRVQIYSLSKGYHRFLTLTNLPQGAWQSAAVDMTRARRPDGSGGPLSEDERIDDIQFYIAPEAELLIDDIVLYEAAASSPSLPRSGGEGRGEEALNPVPSAANLSEHPISPISNEGEGMTPDAFPRRVIFTGWFDTGKQGAEWPGDFDIVAHQPPLTWKAAKSVVNPQTGQPWVRVHLRGARPMSAVNRLRFRYRLAGTGDIRVTLANSRSGQEWHSTVNDGARERWAEAAVDFEVSERNAFADELRFAVANGAEALVDDVLLFEPVADHSARIETDKLRVIIADNAAFGTNHRAGYNGVAELTRTTGARNLFVPQYAGLNLEHIFSGDAQSFGWNVFEPRRAPMQLIRRSANRIELQQERSEHWPLRSRLIYQVTNDAIDFTYCGTPLADAWKKHGYIGVFFASYINQPQDMSLQFIGRSRAGRGDTRPRWIKHLPPKHGVGANHRPAGSTWDPPFDDGFNIELMKGISDFEYVYPFYFGRSGDNVFIMMFEPPRDGSEIRFAQSPSGGGAGNPAWDFVYLQRGYEVNREFCFRARAVLRKFKDAEEVIRLHEQWSGENVLRPTSGGSDAKSSTK